MAGNHCNYYSLAPVFDTNRTLEEMTRELVEIALRRVHGNQSQAAVQLGVSRSTLWRMLHKEKQMSVSL